MLPTFLKPYHTDISNLIRLGRKSDGGYVIRKTKVIEMTLINPKKFKIKKQKTTRNYPIQGLDYKNRKRGPEIKISFKK